MLTKCLRCGRVLDLRVFPCPCYVESGAYDRAKEKIEEHNEKMRRKLIEKVQLDLFGEGI